MVTPVFIQKRWYVRIECASARRERMTCGALLRFVFGGMYRPGIEVAASRFISTGAHRVYGRGDEVVEPGRFRRWFF